VNFVAEAEAPIHPRVVVDLTTRCMSAVQTCEVTQGYHHGTTSGTSGVSGRIGRCWFFGKGNAAGMCRLPIRPTFFCPRGPVAEPSARHRGRTATSESLLVRHRLRFLTDPDPRSPWPNLAGQELVNYRPNPALQDFLDAAIRETGRVITGLSNALNP
jgi:hypothetical protein